jgi:hypothetical protein
MLCRIVMAPGQRPSSRIFGAALLLPLILFSALGTGFQLWRCRFDGVARTSCCCPTKPGTQQAEQRLTMSRARCCDLEQQQIDRDPAEAARGQATRLSDLLAAAATSAVPVSPLPPVPTTSFAPAHPSAGDAPPAGRSLVIQKQSFLI